ncbi:MAG: hypothetical protein ACOH2M_27560 [Cypionkella sp.]
MAPAFTLAKISPPEASATKVKASGANILTSMKALPALCRPAGWIAQWRKIGAMSVLNRKAQA